MSIRSHLGLKAAAALVAIGGLGVGLIGTGVTAQFTSSGSAVANINVGTMGIQLSSTYAGANVVGNTVTVNLPAIQASAASQSTFPFTVTNTGSMPVHFTVSSVISGQAPAGDPQFTDAFVNAGPYALAASPAAVTLTGGFAWPTLDNTNMGQLVTITYTVNATA